MTPGFDLHLGVAPRGEGVTDIEHVTGVAKRCIEHIVSGPWPGMDNATKHDPDAGP